MSIILTTIVALEHFYIFYLESIATQSDATSRVFNMEKEELAHPSVSLLFKNQGIYKDLLGVFLLYGIYFSQNLEIVTIFVLFVIGAATYGSLTADKKIILKQGGSAILALISILLFKYT
ncbi:integral membrane protein [Streptococcus pneumoniae]|nr:integral membrane protein [Streptococcus pneumoniae]